ERVFCVDGSVEVLVVKRAVTVLVLDQEHAVVVRKGLQGRYSGAPVLNQFYLVGRHAEGGATWQKRSQDHEWTELVAGLAKRYRKLLCFTQLDVLFTHVHQFIERRGRSRNAEFIQRLLVGDRNIEARDTKRHSGPNSCLFHACSNRRVVTRL